MFKRKYFMSVKKVDDNGSSYSYRYGISTSVSFFPNQPKVFHQMLDDIKEGMGSKQEDIVEVVAFNRI